MHWRHEARITYPTRLNSKSNDRYFWRGEKILKVLLKFMPHSPHNNRMHVSCNQKLLYNEE